MRSLTTLAVVIAACALTAAGALATNSAPVYGPHAEGITVITDTLGGNGHRKHAPAVTYRFITDTLGGNGGQTVAVTNSVGFSWSAAGVGAAATAGALIALLGASLLVVRRRSGLAV